MTATMTTPITQPIPSEAIKLFITPEPNGHVDSVVPLEWCITPEVQAELVERGGNKHWLFVVVAHGKREVDRYLFPLLAYKGYICFRNPGRNTVLATIVWKGSGTYDKHNPHSLLHRTRSGSYEHWATDQVDAELTRLYNDYHALQDRLWRERSELNALIANRPAEIDPDAAEAVDETEAQIASLQTQIGDLEEEIRRLQEGEAYVAREELVYDEATNEAAIAECEEAVARLTTDTERAQEAYLQRSASPEYVLVMQNHLSTCSRSRYGGTLDVEVPETMFAKPSWKITHWFGTRYRWPMPAKEPCDLRRRALFTVFTGLFILPALLVLEILQIIGVAVLILWGKRGINYRALLRPSLHSITGIGNDLGRSVWYWKKLTDGAYTQRSLATRLIGPPTLAAIAVLAFVANHFWGRGALSWALYVPAGVVTGLLIGLLIAPLLNRKKPAKAADQSNKPAKAKLTHEEAKEARKQAARIAAKAALAKELDAITCGVTAPETRQTYLPAERRVQFLYHDVKRRLCKPFPGAR